MGKTRKTNNIERGIQVIRIIHGMHWSVKGILIGLMVVAFFTGMGTGKAWADELLAVKCDDPEDRHAFFVVVPDDDFAAVISHGFNPVLFVGTSTTTNLARCVSSIGFCIGFGWSLTGRESVPESPLNTLSTAKVFSTSGGAFFDRLHFGLFQAPFSVPMAWCTNWSVFERNSEKKEALEISSPLYAVSSLGQIPIGSAMPEPFASAIRVAAWVEEHSDIEPEDMVSAFTKEAKMNLKEIYLKFDPGVSPIKPTYEFIEGGFNLGTFRSNGGNADLHRAVNFDVRAENAACVLIDDEKIFPLNGVGKSLPNTNVPGSGYIQVTASGFGSYEGKLRGGLPLLDVLADVKLGPECESESARTVTVKLKKVMNEYKLDVPVGEPVISIVLPIPVPAGTVQGITTLQFRERTAGRVLVKITCPGGHMDSTSPANDGTWQIAGVPAEETCIVIATAPGYLSAQGEVTGGRYGVAMPTNELLGGDANNDGIVALNDITDIIAHFTQLTEDCEIDEKVYDVNCDGVVTLSDVSIATDNFGKGPQMW